MGLEHYILDKLSKADTRKHLGSTAFAIVDKIDEVATDFLEWYISEEDDAEFQPRSIAELYEQFKIQKGL